MEKESNIARNGIIQAADNPMTVGQGVSHDAVEELERVINNNRPARSGIMQSVGEIIWINEEAKKRFTDSEGRLHSVAYIDPDTGERILC